MSDYRRGLISSVNKDKTPKIVVRYNVKEQGMTNDDLSILKDLSGNGRDMALYGFSGTESSGVVYGSLILDGVKDYGKVNNLPILEDFTLLVKRKWLLDTPKSGTLLSKSTDIYSFGAFYIERITAVYSEVTTRSYGGTTLFNPSKLNNEMIYITPTSYDGIKMDKGNEKDTSIMLLGKEYPGSKSYANISFSSLVLYNKTLTPEEIEEAKKLL